MDSEQTRKALEEAERKASEKPPKASREELAMDEEDYQPPLRNAGSKRPSIGGGMNVIVAVVISLVLCYAMVSQFIVGNNYVSRKDFDANWAGMVATMEQSKIEMVQSKSTMDAAVSNIPQAVNNALAGGNNNLTQQINSLSNQLSEQTSQLSGVNQKITELESQLSIDKSTIESLNTQITELGTRLDTIESGGSPASVDLDLPFTFETRIVNENVVYDALADVTTMTFYAKLILTNSTAYDIEDISLEIPINIDLSTISGTGEVLTWDESSSSWYLSDKDLGEDEAYALLNGSSITLDASDREKLTVGMTITVNGEVADFDVDIDDSEIEIDDWGYE